MTSPWYSVAPVTQEHVTAAAMDMRPADRAEVWALAHLTPLRALEVSVKGSNRPWAGLYGDDVLCLFGVSEMTLISRVGVPWMLSTHNMAKHVQAVGRTSLRYIRQLRREYDWLENYVDARHELSIKWLEWMGFTLEPALPFGIDRLPFHRFTLEGTR